MKFTFLPLAVVAVASYSTVQGFQMMAAFRRAVDNVANAAAAIPCLVSAFAGTPLSPECKSRMGIDFGVIQSIQLSSVTIDFTGPEPAFFSDGVAVELIKLPVEWDVADIQEDVTIVNNNVDVASFSTAVAVSSKVSGTSLSTTITKCNLKVDAAMEAAYGAFIADLVTKREHTFYIRGVLAMKLKISLPSLPGADKVADPLRGLRKRFGPVPVPAPIPVPAPSAPGLTPISISGVAFGSDMTLLGFDNLAVVEYVSNSYSTDATGVSVLTLTINIVNPSLTTINFGEVTFKAEATGGVAVGDAVIAGFNIAPGDNEVKVVITSKDNAAILKNIAENGDTLSLNGFAQMSKNAIVSFALVNLKLSVVVTGPGATATA
ncbi:hypothetical protein BGX23_008433 [Mortierella sp. AD031]|nr:hypothetical protein BGX23_008433 [Mortierella sp. AD031]